MVLSDTILIVGAGPVGLCLALDLAQRGIDVTVLEQRHAGERPSVKCNHVSSRTMEMFRRLGFAAEVRQVGLPDDYPNDVVVRTQATGYELTRIHIPCRRSRYIDVSGPDGWWPTPEPPHRVNQIYFEPILFAHAAANRRIRILNRTLVEQIAQTGEGVSLRAHNLDSGETINLTGRYLIGCDGGRSLVRKAIGAKLFGDEVIQRVQSTYLRAPELINQITQPNAWMSYLYHPARAGNLVAIDGNELWLLHNYLLPHEPDFDSVDRDACVRLLLGVGPEFEYELLAKEDWIGRRLVADRLQDRRIFICGDAAHLWVPYAGYGMNAGIADAMNLSWKLAAHLRGWASETILDAYEVERLPITDQVSRFAMTHAMGAIKERTSVPPDVLQDTAAGEAIRKEIGAAAYELHVQQFACAGLNFGYFYPDSPLIVYDGEAAPVYTMFDYTPSTAPGCRTPHLWLEDGRSLYDALGPDYTLLRFDVGLDVQPLMSAAAQARIPIALLDVSSAAVPDVYRHKLVLNRPDAHIAWRGDAVPANPADLIALISGRKLTSSSRLGSSGTSGYESVSVNQA
ncbi:MAG: FAD-dependent oxidoreductase [Steroidobacteraceae bacterium]